MLTHKGLVYGIFCELKIWTQIYMYYCHAEYTIML